MGVNSPFTFFDCPPFICGVARGKLPPPPEKSPKGGRRTGERTMPEACLALPPCPLSWCGVVWCGFIACRERFKFHRSRYSGGLCGCFPCPRCPSPCTGLSFVAFSRCLLALPLYQFKPYRQRALYTAYLQRGCLLSPL